MKRGQREAVRSGPRGIRSASARVCLVRGAALFRIYDSLCVYAVDLALSVSINEDKCGAVLQFHCTCVARSLKSQKESGEKSSTTQPFSQSSSQIAADGCLALKRATDC